MEKKSPTYYSFLPAQFTGDLWHMAAASILTNRYPIDNQKMEFITVLVLCKGALWTKEGRPIQKPQDMEPTDWTDHQDEFDKQRLHGKATFNYLRSVGAKVMFLVLDNIPDSANSWKQCFKSNGNELEWYMRRFVGKRENLDDLYKTFVNFGKTYHLDEYEDLLDALAKSISSVNKTGGVPDEWSLVRKLDPDFWVKGNTYRFEASGERILRFYASTTIAIKLLEDKKERTNRINALRYNMRGGNLKTAGDIQQEAEDLVKQLINQADKQPDRGFGEGPATGKICIFNFRESQANKHTNNSYKQLKEFRKFANDANCRIIVLDASQEGLISGAQNVCGYPVFDLYNKNKPEVKFPGREPLVTSAFWAEIAKNEQILGVFSGRTGSVDVAIFNGVNCLWWDEPWVHNAAQDPVWAKGWKNSFDTDDREIFTDSLYLGKTVDELSEIRQNMPADWRYASKAEQAASTISVSESQLPQFLRCVQLSLISTEFFYWHRYELGDGDNIIKTWLAGKDVIVNLAAPTVTYKPQNWFYWKTPTEPYKLSYYRSSVEYGKGLVSGTLKDLNYLQD